MSEKGLSRRDFLVSAGSFAASALATGGVLGAVTPAMAAAPALPWPYVTLDPSAVMQTAYNGYFVGGCMYATGNALVSALAAATGSPWNTYNPDFFKFGGSGIAGWGTLCGALNSAVAVIQMTAGSSAAAVMNELFGWYCGYSFPSTRMDSYARYATNQTQTVSHSPLCHQSSGIWCDATNSKINATVRKDRCAKLAGDVAYQTAVYLNAVKAGTFAPTFTAPDYQADSNSDRCFTCHVGTSSTRDDVQGKMNCLQCHDDKAGHKL